MKALLVMLFSISALAAEHPIQLTATEGNEHYLGRTLEMTALQDGLYPFLKSDDVYKDLSDNDLADLEYRIVEVELSCDAPACWYDFTLEIHDGSTVPDALLIELYMNDQYPDDSARVTKISRPVF